LPYIGRSKSTRDKSVQYITNMITIITNTSNMTYMSNHTTLIDTLRVHIAPVGFEVDRILFLLSIRKQTKYGLLHMTSLMKTRGILLQI